MIVYVTKYAASSGIIELDAEDVGDGMISYKPDGGFTSYYHKGEWHTDKAVALQKALDVIAKKRTSIKKQLLKLDEMEKKIQNDCGYTITADGHGIS